MRYADVLLMAAELGSPNAQAYFNQVRQRAYTVNDGEGNLSVSDDYREVAVTKENIIKERMLEFAFEGQYWYDLLRLYSRQELLEHMKAKNPNFSAKDFLLPIPYDEHKLDPTRMYQNEGYN